MTAILVARTGSKWKPMTDALQLAGWLAAIGAVLAIHGAIIYVAVHFIAKYW